MLVMTAQAQGMSYEQFRGNGWTDELLIEHGYAVEYKLDWSKAPEWAVCVVSRNHSMDDYHWSSEPRNGALLKRIETGTEFVMSKPTAWTRIESRPPITLQQGSDITLPNDVLKWEALSPNDQRLQQIFTPADSVNHPGHYTQGGIECIDAIAAATVGKTGIEAVCVANVIKYLWRYELKNGVEDIKKAQWYLNKLLEVKTDENISDDS